MTSVSELSTAGGDTEITEPIDSIDSQDNLSESETSTLLDINEVGDEKDKAEGSE